MGKLSELISERRRRQENPDRVSQSFTSLLIPSRKRRRIRRVRQPLSVFPGFSKSLTSRTKLFELE